MEKVTYSPVIRETIYVPLKSMKYDTSKLVMEITVRVYWSDADGMVAEPCRYRIAGGDIEHSGTVNVTGDNPTIFSDAIYQIVQQEYTDDVLQEFLMYDQAFEAVRRDNALQDRLDLEWERRNVL
jgi:spore coat polysaccharide biosynthesis protein SpsF (cytidylyltransferase family)